MTRSATTRKRALGIVRVSETKGREGDSFASPREQRGRIEDACSRDDLDLLDVFEELDVSGGTPIEKRAGLRRAVEAVENGDADVIVAAYFDRLVRSLRVQDELVSRVERAGGQVLAVDVGQVTNGSAGQWLSGTMLGAVSEYQRRSAKERSHEAQHSAIVRGVAPWPNISPGYVRGDDGRLVPDPQTAPHVAEAFALRADGATVQDVRRHLRAHGIERSYHGVGSLLRSRVVLGEIHFGDYQPNLSAHEPIVDAETWRRVQRVSVPRGRRPKSERLLARLGVLRCASCGARMVIGSSNNSDYKVYRCPPNGDCPQHMSISATIVEEVVVKHVRAALADVEGRASAESNAREAEVALEQAQANLDAALRTFAGFEDELGARERLLQLRDDRDAAQERVSRLGSLRTAASVTVADWDRLTLDERRSLIRATVDRVLVGPGRGPDRVSVHLFTE